MVKNNFSLKKTSAPLTIATVLLAFGWFYFFIDIGSLLDAIQDLGTNSTEANIADSLVDEVSPSEAIGQDGQDGKDGQDGISIEDDQGTAIANAGSIGNGGAGGEGGDGGTATGSTAIGGDGGDGGDGGAAIILG